MPRQGGEPSDSDKLYERIGADARARSDRMGDLVGMAAQLLDGTISDESLLEMRDRFTPRDAHVVVRTLAHAIIVARGAQRPNDGDPAPSEAPTPRED